MAKCWQIVSAGEETKTAEIRFYGDIGDSKNLFSDDITPKQFARDIDALGDVDQIDVHIHSNGGSLAAAMAIHNKLKQHKATIRCFVDGSAHSAASLVAMSGDRVLMPSNTMMMIHNPSVRSVSGDHRDLKKYSNIVEGMRDSMIPVYQNKTKLSPEKIKSMLDEETWLSAQQALDLGFADEILDPVEVVALAGDRYIVNSIAVDYSNFSKLPAAIIASAKEPLMPLEDILSNVGISINDEILDVITNAYNSLSFETRVQVNTLFDIENIIPAAVLGGKEVVTNMADKKTQEPEKEPEAAEDIKTSTADGEEPEAEAATNAAPTVSDEIVAERQRIRDIAALARPGAEKIIENAISSGKSAADTALEICNSPEVKNKAVLQARKGESPNVGADTDDLSTDKHSKNVGILAKAFNKVRGIK